MEKDLEKIIRLEKEIIRLREELDWSEQKYRSLVDNSPSGIMIIGDNYTVEYVNKELTKILKCKAKDMIGTNFLKIVAEEDKSIIAERYINRREGILVPNRYEFHVKTFDGSNRHLELTSSVIASVAGAKKSVAQVIDITERKEAEKALQNSEERYRTLVENSPDGVFLSDLKGNLITANKAVLDMHGYSSVEELIEKEANVFNFIVEDERELVHKNASKVLKEGIANNLKYTLLRKDGSTFPAEISSTLIKDGEGNPVGFMALTRDISVRMKAEQELKATTERLSNIFRAANDGMWSWNLLTDEVDFDPRYYEMAGYEENEFPHRLEEFQLRVHPGDVDSVMKAAQNHLDGITERFIEEFRFLKKDGDWMWIMGRGIIVDKDDNGVPLRLVGTHTDISENMKILQDLQIEKQRAQESDRLKSAFLANMSHEIRTPMNGILGFADLLSSENLEDDQRTEYLRIIQKSGDRMLNTINDIIDISKIESEQAELFNSETNINDQLDYLYEFFMPEADLKGLKLSIKKPLENTAAIINTDKEKLFAIISNLIKNAIKYSHKGSIEVGYKMRDNMLEFYVKDEGIGISPNSQDAIFDRFVQANLTITKEYEGSGLGLAISKGFVELMGGKISVESNLGKGSMFCFTIPNMPIANNIKHTNTIMQAEQNKRFKDLSILIAEDDESAFFYLSEILKRYSKQIFRANNGQEAIDICKNNKDIDLVLMDIKMPDVDGFEATREIRKFNKTIPIIAQTAFAMVGDQQKVKDAGCNDYISKPIERNELYEILLKYL